MITSHPYLDNNGPTYFMGGVCENGRCGAAYDEHETMIRQKSVGSRRYIASTSPQFGFIRWWRKGDSA